MICNCDFFPASTPTPCLGLTQIAALKGPFFFGELEAMPAHPVLDALAREKTVSARDLDFLAEHGRSYRGVSLPAHIRRRPIGTCLDTADELEDAGHGRFVRGFALLPDDYRAQMHAWNSRDGRTAIDAVWPSPHRCHYWGLDRRHEVRLSGMVKRPLISIPSFAFRL